MQPEVVVGDGHRGHDGNLERADKLEKEIGLPSEIPPDVGLDLPRDSGLRHEIDDVILRLRPYRSHAVQQLCGLGRVVVADVFLVPLRGR
ncbi:hypothetical protein GFL38_10670 [Rhizobium leguminosarum bv. viciae]|uniref:hypothetical protein n=1 Tax=Rhizobium ruizarguesonis TaxID=2081791 RepID=UPI00143F4492|nr:hypothetical protein [Rhizobium ruizarguesonis]NKJ72723.1 hypothetical protein [Rhizobium leguminosarum bv. viciae]NKQ80403.1 hypothetical protein [Rhizobium ruizarguesonis]